MGLLKRIAKWGQSAPRIVHPNDWKLIWSDYGNWFDPGNNNNHLGIAIYDIEYSKSRDIYRLQCSGRKPFKHSMYGVAKKKVIEYNLKTTNEGNKA